MDGRTAAAVLGVAPGATNGEIVGAYRARAKVAHPDGAGTAEAFVQLRTAFELLLSAPPASPRDPRPTPWIGADGRQPAPVIDLTDAPSPAPYWRLTDAPAPSWRLTGAPAPAPSWRLTGAPAPAPVRPDGPALAPASRARRFAACLDAALNRADR